MAKRAAAPAVKATPAKPMRALMTIGLFAAIVCGVGFAAVAAIKGVAKSGHPGSFSSPAAPSGDGGSSLSASGKSDVVAALSSGNTQQALNLMQSIGSSGPSTLKSAGDGQQPPTMQNQTPPPAPVLEAGKEGMPDDVRNWLEHLRRIEDMRLTLAATQLQDAVKTLSTLQAGDITHALDDEDNSSKEAEAKKQSERAQGIGNDMASMQQAWRTLLAAFDSVPAPAECAGAKRNYDQVVGATGSMIMDVVGQIKSSEKDPQAAVSALTAMQGRSKSQIDVPARATDQSVASICRKYDVVKWFDIQSDVGSGTMSQLGF